MEWGKSGDRESHSALIAMLGRGLLAGLVSGVVLGFLMKLIQHLTGSAVYVLLLNVDFIKWLPSQMPEWAEFMLHLSISLPLGIIYLSLLRLWDSPIRLSLLLSFAVACCTWIPLTQLSERTPSIDDFEALLWWIIGHLTYGLILSLFGYNQVKKRSLPS